ncbi:MAG: folate family ECF transporter S component [Ruminococcaceae bacterium]|nr:folate family ECF transporter S component [Oscillospiraceae bacterium]
MSKQNNPNLKLYGNIRALCISSLLCALSVIIAFICKLYLNFDVLGGSVRLTLENLPIIISGIAYGPFVGLAVGASADIINTAVSQYGVGGINPLITLGAASVGFISGLCFKITKCAGAKTSVFVSVFAAHLFGSVILKSLGLYLYHFYIELKLFGISFNSLLLRIPTYIIIASLEYYLICIFSKNKSIRAGFGLPKC